MNEIAIQRVAAWLRENRKGYSAQRAADHAQWALERALARAVDMGIYFEEHSLPDAVIGWLATQKPWLVAA